MSNSEISLFSEYTCSSSEQVFPVSSMIWSWFLDCSFLNCSAVVSFHLNFLGTSRRSLPLLRMELGHVSGLGVLITVWMGQWSDRGWSGRTLSERTILRMPSASNISAPTYLLAHIKFSAGNSLALRDHIIFRNFSLPLVSPGLSILCLEPLHVEGSRVTPNST